MSMKTGPEIEELSAAPIPSPPDAPAHFLSTRLRPVVLQDAQHPRITTAIAELSTSF